MGLLPPYGMTGVGLLPPFGRVGVGTKKGPEPASGA